MTTIKQRRGTAAQWTTANPVLAAGEPGVETDTGNHKVGDGTTAWNSLKTTNSATYVPAYVVAAPSGSAATDTANIQAAITTAQAVGATVRLVVGTYQINAPINITGPVALEGAGRNGTQLKATSAIATVLNATSTTPGLMRDFQINGNSLATNCHTLNTAEGSVPWVIENLECYGATGYQYVNTGCEDTVYRACINAGNESLPTTTPNAIQISTPGGAVSLIACEFFGQIEVSVQQLNVDGGVGGPFYLHAPGGSANIVQLNGVYIYDGGLSSRACISAADAGGLPCVSMNGCYLVAQVVADFVSGGGMQAGASTVSANDCVFVQTAGLGATPTSHVLNATAGNLTLSGGASTLTGTLLPATTGPVVRVSSPVAGLSSAPAPAPSAGGALGCIPISGRYYTPDGDTTTAGFSAAGDIRAAPFHLSVPSTLYRIGAMVTTIGDAGSKVRLGVYTDSGGKPGALVVDAGQIAGDSAAAQEITLGTPLALAPGRYWLVAAGQTFSTTSPVMRSLATSGTEAVGAGSLSNAVGLASPLPGFSGSGVTGALPGTFPAISDQTNVVKVAVRFGS